MISRLLALVCVFASLVVSSPTHPIHVRELIENLRDDWELPSEYLKYRGYMSKRSENKTKDDQLNFTIHDPPINRNSSTSFIDKIKSVWENWFHHNKSNETNKTVRSTDWYYDASWIDMDNSVKNGKTKTNYSNAGMDSLEESIAKDKQNIRCILNCLRNNKKPKNILDCTQKQHDRVAEKNLQQFLGEKTNSSSKYVFSCSKTQKHTQAEMDSGILFPNQTQAHANKTLNETLPRVDKEYDNLLKYLAHLHHPVDQIGKPKHVPVDLKKIEELIDKIKYNPDNCMVDVRNKDARAGEKKSKPSVLGNFLLPPFSENFLTSDEMTRSKRKTKHSSFTEKLNEIASKLSKSLNLKKPDEVTSIADAKDDEPTQNETDQTDDFNDLVNLKRHLSANQQEDIEKFRKNLQLPPKTFDFNIESFLDMKSSAAKLIEPEKQLVTPRAYFEFSIPQISDSDDVPMAPANQPIEEFSTIDDATLNLTTAETMLNAYPFPYEVGALQQTAVKQDLIQYNKDSDDFIDKYYLLNDGKANEEDHTLPATANLNMQDLNIDLKLNKEFHDLEFEKDRRMYSTNAEM